MCKAPQYSRIFIAIIRFKAVKRTYTSLKKLLPGHVYIVSAAKVDNAMGTQQMQEAAAAAAAAAAAEEEEEEEEDEEEEEERCEVTR